MLNKSPARIKDQLHIDQTLMLTCCSLLSIGFLMVTSASLHLGVKMANDISHYPFKQLLHIMVGLIFATGLAKVSMRTWEQLGQTLFIAGLALLLIVLIPGIGVKVNGSIRWLSILGLRIQVSEVVKFISVIYIAGYVTRHSEHVRQSAFGLLKPLMLFSVACVLLLLEPDFGSAVVILIIAMGMMFLGGARLSQFVVLLALVSALAVMLVYISPYRLARVLSFRDPGQMQKTLDFN